MKNQNRYSKNYFDSGEYKIGQYASYEQDRFYPAFQAMAKELKKNIKAKRILDVGCAKGFLVDVLIKEGYEVYGTDISEFAINESPSNVRPYLNICDLNVDRLPHEDSSFDIIICMGTLEYVENQDKALKEIVRVLKPNGYLFITTLDHTPKGDELRKFTKKEPEWNTVFSSLGFVSNEKIAIKVISQYVKKIIPYDVRKGMLQSQNESIKRKVARFLLSTPVRYAIFEFFYYRQVKSGYLQLCYQKSNRIE